MEKNKKNYHIALILILITTSFFVFYYIPTACRNLVMVDYWRMSCQYIPDVMQGKVNILSTFKGEWGQSNAFLKLSLIANIKFFHLNSMISEYLGIIILGLIAFLIFVNCFKEANVNKNRRFECLCFMPVILSVFNMNQWEIIGSQFSFSFTLRVFLYLVVAILLDKSFEEKASIKQRRKYVIFSGIIAFISIILLSQLYFPAMVVSLGIIIVFKLTVMRGNQEIERYPYIIWIIMVSLGIVIYGINVSSSLGQSSVAGSSNLVNHILDGTAFWGMFVMLASIIIPQIKIQQMSSFEIYFIGMVIAAIIIYSLIIYIKDRLYIVSTIPAYLILYGGISICAIEYGRLGMSDLLYLSSSRYVCETTSILTGCFLILYYKINKSQRSGMIVSSIIMIGLSVTLINSAYIEKNMAAARGAYKDEAIQLLYNIDDVTDDELGILQANNANQVREGTELLKKYSLNVFSE